MGGVGSALFGGRSSAGIMGTGQFVASPYDIDKNAFNPDQNESSFTQMLQQRAAGQGPSVAQLQMQQGADLAANNAMAVAASQRGIAPALAARMAAQQQSSIAQNTNRDSGMLRANEMLANQNSLGQELQSQRQGRMMGEQLGVQNATGANTVNASAYDNAATRRSNVMGGVGSGIMAAALMNRGGVVPGFAEGGAVEPGFMQQWAQGMDNLQGTIDKIGITDKDSGSTKMGKDLGFGIAKSIMGGGGGGGTLMAGGPMDAGGAAALAPAVMVASNGARVPGHAEMSGDSPANDTVPAMLSPGEIVIPRTVVQQGPDAIRLFAQAIMRQK